MNIMIEAFGKKNESSSRIIEASSRSRGQR
jgi:hypothetical protein